MAIFDRTFDEVSNTSFSRRTARTQNVYRRRSLLQRIRTRKLQSPRRDHAVHVSLSSYAVVKEPEAGPTSYARPTSAVRAVWHIPSVSPNEATFNTLPNPLSTLSFEPIDRFAERRISSSAAAPPSLERFIRIQPKTVNTQRRKIFKRISPAAVESPDARRIPRVSLWIFFSYPDGGTASRGEGFSFRAR